MSSKKDNRQLRAIGHKLKPVVTVAGNGLSEGVLLEIERALGDHELIKLKLVAGDRAAREALGQNICQQTGAEMIQAIGSVILILRRSTEPDPRLSNLIRL
ncbi:MAG: YhbY family RNA-binding protein [Gammaproteobacteria bacterium]|nr:YhbY family RNA-binding protein [Gammaproteobacteria bacterium]